MREVDSGRGTLWMDCRGAPGVCMLGASASACLLSFIIFFKKAKQTSLVAQRLRLHAQNAGGPGSIPRATTKISSVLQQGFTIPYAATKTQCSQINKRAEANILKVFFGKNLIITSIYYSIPYFCLLILLHLKNCTHCILLTC